MMNTFIIVNITPIYKEDKSMFVPSKKVFILPSVWPGTEQRLFERRAY